MPALNAGAVQAGIFKGSPVWGFLPVLAALSLVSNVPKPTSCTLSLFSNAVLITFTKEFIVASVSFLERPVSLLITILKCIEMKENYQYKKTQSKKIVNLNW